MKIMCCLLYNIRPHAVNRQDSFMSYLLFIFSLNIAETYHGPRQISSRPSNGILI